MSNCLIGDAQRNILNGIASGWQLDTSGLTQNSVLRTVFFNVFINYLYPGTLSKVGDDIQLEAVDSMEGRERLQRDLHRL